MDTPLANWNGQEMPLAEVRVSVLDRAFLFGDGVYEVIRVYGGRPWKLDDHLSRLGDSLAAIKIKGVDLDALRQRLSTTLSHSGLSDALIYIQVTRGEARRTHHFPAESTPNQLIYVERFDDPFEERRKAGAAAITHGDIRWSLNHIKAVSMLANCLAAEAAVAAGCTEAILVDDRGMVSEGSHTSVFAVRGGHVLVSPASPHILPGITKKQILYLSQKASIPVSEERLSKETLFGVDELFLSGTPEEILPVTEVDGQRIGDGRPGPVTRKLQESFRRSVEDWLSRTSALEA